MAEPFAAALRRYIRSGYRATEAMRAVWHDVKLGRVARPPRSRRHAGIRGVSSPRRSTLARLKRERVTLTPRQRRAMGWNPAGESDGTWMRWLPPRKVVQIRQGLEGPVREVPATGQIPATVYRHPFAWVRVDRPSRMLPNPVAGFEAFDLQDRRGWEAAIRSVGGLKIAREDRGDFAEVPGYLKGYRRGVSPDVLVQMVADERGLPARAVENALLEAFHAPRRRRAAALEDYEALEREAIQTEGRRRPGGESRPRVRVGAEAFTLRPRSPFKGVIHHVSNSRRRTRGNPAVDAPPEYWDLLRQADALYSEMYRIRQRHFQPTHIGLGTWGRHLPLGAQAAARVRELTRQRSRLLARARTLQRRIGPNPALGMPVPRAAAGLKVETRLVRSRGYRPDQLPAIASSEDVAALARRLPDSDRERSLALYLNTKNRVIGIQQLSIGARSATLIPVDALLRTALLTNAAGMILVHNHPSGDPTPSREDIAIFRRLKDAGDLVDVKALDAVVVANGAHRSIADMGGG